MAVPEGIGGLVGLGARIYALVTIGNLLGTGEPLREAQRLAAQITPERIEADARFDVTLGAAGALLALLALEAALPAEHHEGPEPLDLAAGCVRHLLTHRLPTETGFAHGAGGIAYALARFAARTGDPRAQAAARQAIACERSLLGQSASQTTWCRGVPGIALARLGALDVLDDAEIRAEIHAALATTRTAGLTPMDHLCCGNLGRAEVLLEAGTSLDDRDLVESAQDLARQVLARAVERGGFSWLPSGEIGSFDPSFFKGAAGVGYTLLRLTTPRSLPCVLRLGSASGPR
jgi:lantibiotic modifying enzyme